MTIDGEETILYGQLQYILDFSIQFEQRPIQKFLLVVIKPCETANTDAAKQKTYFSAYRQEGIADLACLVSVVGRVPVGQGRYGIIDRSMEDSWPTVCEDRPNSDSREELAPID
jgi:hypothetical protein